MAGRGKVAKVDHQAPGHLTVRQPGSRIQELLDARLRTFTEDEADEAAEQLVKRAGPLVASVLARVADSWEPILAELNQMAGGQASGRVMVLARHALSAHSASELQGLLAQGAIGDDLRNDGDRSALLLRNMAGLSVVATDLLNKAYAAAREDAAAAQAAQGGPVGGLMSRLGVSQAPGSAPVLTPGVGSIGAPLPKNSEPKNPPPSSPPPIPGFPDAPVRKKQP